MMYPLFEYYSHRGIDLYQVRKHYLEHFYYMNHSRNEAENVLKSVAGSSKVGRLIGESARGSIVPTCENFMNVICSMFKFMFKSNETTALAVIDAALRWDIEVNQEMHLISSEELKQNIIKVFDKLSIYEEMSEEEYQNPAYVTATVDAEIVEEPKKELMLEHNSNRTTWSFLSFAKEFGEDVSVGKFARKSDGEVFYSCIFMDKEKHKTFVGFSQKLGVLTSEEISQMKEELVVIKSPSGNYNLYKDNGTAWKKVEL